MRSKAGPERRTHRPRLARPIIRPIPGAAALALALALVLPAPYAGAGSASAAVPDDLSFGLQWGASNTGQSIPTQNGAEELGPPQNGLPGVDDRAAKAWDVSTGDTSVVIGELDSGLQYGHPDLEGNIWTNPGGVGGCPAGTHGFNALNDSCDPSDEDEAYGGHGTHVAGIMGAVGDNGHGVAGMNWETSVLPVKWVQSASTETGGLLNAIRWLLRVSEEGVNIRVVNDSLTFVGTAYSAEVKRAIEMLGEHNILFVTAAGNTGNNNDEESVRRYPCGYHLANEICVTAIGNRGELPRWAGFGPHTVDLAAPGESIYSTLRGGYGYLSGGSMASAQVAGAAALILSVAPTLSARELKADILGHVDALPALHEKLITGGTLDVCRAMPGCEASAPTVLTQTPSSLTQTSARLRGQVNPNRREVTICRFEYGPSTQYGESAQCVPMPGGGTSAVEVSSPIEELSPNTTYHVRIVAGSSAGTSTGADQTFTTLPTPPSVAALAPSPVTQSEATLRATVNPHGVEVRECHFEYGTSSEYGESAQCPPIPEGANTPVEVSVPVSGLAARTTYHFRVVASNAGGSGGGGDHTFTTQPPGPTASAPEASAITQTGATLSAAVNPNGAEVSDCHFDYGRSSAYGASVACASPPGSGTRTVLVTAALSGLSAGTTYHFRAVAVGAGGTSVGPDQSFATAASPAGVATAAGAAASQAAGSGPASTHGGASGSALSYTQPVRALLVLPGLMHALLRVGDAGVARALLACPAGVETCRGEIELRIAIASGPKRSSVSPLRRGASRRMLVTIARARFVIAPRASAAVALVLSRRALELLARRHSVRALATLVAPTLDARTLSTTVPVILRPAGKTPPLRPRQALPRLGLSGGRLAR